MAQSITIDIIANFIDNASSKTDALSKKIDTLEASAKRLSSTANAGQRLSSGLIGTHSAFERVNTTLGTNINSLSAYKNSLKSASSTLAERQSALITARNNYERNTQAIEANINSLQKEKTSISALMTSKQSEISMLEKSNSIINRGSKVYNDNLRAIEWTKTELSGLESRYNKVNSSIASHHNSMRIERENYSAAKEAVRSASREYETLSGNLKAVKRESMFGGISNFASGTGNILKKATGIGGAIKNEIVSGLGAATDKIFNVKNLMMGAATGAAAHQLVINPVSYADEMTTAHIGFETMLGSSQLADNMLNELQEFAAKTPFDTKGLISSSQQILRAEIATSPDDIVNVLTKIGNAASAAGQGTEGVQGIVMALQQMSMAGRVNAQDMMQLTNRGVKAWKYVADGLGVSLTAARKMSEDGLVPAGDAIQYILTGMQEYDGMMDKVSKKTVSGLISNIGDTIENKIKLPWGEGLQAGMTAGLGEMADWLDTINPQLEEAGDNLRDFANDLSNDVVKGLKSLANFEVNIIGGEQFKNAATVGDKIGVLVRENIEGAFENHPLASTLISGWILGKGASKVKSIGGKMVDFIGKDAIKSAGSKIASSFSGSGIGASVASGISSSPLALMAGIAVAGQGVLDIIDAVRERSYLSSLNFTKDMNINQGALTEYTKQWQELNDLKWERNELTGQINSGGLGEAESETAKQRIQEIDDLLKKDYNIDITCDTSELDIALDKAQALSELQMATNINEIQKGFDNENGFKNTQQRLYADTRDLDNEKKTLQDMTEKETKLTALKNRYEAGTISEAELYDGANKITGYTIRDMTDFNSVLNYNNEHGRAVVQENINRLSKRVDEGRESTTKFHNMAVETANSELSLYRKNKAAGLDTSYDLFNMDIVMQNSDLNKLSYAGELAAAQSGFESFETAVQSGGDKLGEITTNVMDNMQRWGATGPQIATAGGLVANGFQTIQDVLNSTDENALSNVENDINRYAQSLHLIDENSHIELSASGDLSVIDNLTGKMQEVNTAGGLSISVNAEGNISVLDQAGVTVAELKESGAVELKVNASGNYDVLDKFGEKVAEIDKTTGKIIEAPILKPKLQMGEFTIDKALKKNGLGMSNDITITGTANYELGTSPEEVPDATGVANYTGNFSRIGPAPTRYGNVVYTPTIIGAAPDSPAAKYNLGTWHWANGTDNAPAGLAYVNDDGSAYPYELIEHSGEFRMYEGRNVLTRLEKGDRVYTSSETKDILSGRSIPRYAQGLNNDVINNIPIVSGSSGGVNVEVGGISVTIQIDGNSKGGNIVEQITSHSTEIAEVITAELERHLSASFANSGGGG